MLIPEYLKKDESLEIVSDHILGLEAGLRTKLAKPIYWYVHSKYEDDDFD